MKRILKVLMAACLLGVSGLPPLDPARSASRIKDITSLQTARDNQLLGYGLVIGLQGSGDSLRNAPFTEQSLRTMLENLGIFTEGGQTRARNVAAVVVTANLPPFASEGSRIDVSVSSLGDATSLRGGTLVLTSLAAADGEIYAVAQGSVVVTGFAVEGEAAELTQNVTTSGRIPGGAIIEREIQAKFSQDERLVLQLRNPDFSTAVAIADVVNAYGGAFSQQPIATARNSTEVVVRKPQNVDLARLMAGIENLAVETDAPARVVINERTGTIVIGHDVRISRVAVSYGTLTIQVTETPIVVQPEPFARRGQTAVEPNTDILALADGGQVAILDGPNLQSLVAGLNSIGVKPDGIISILQSIKTAGALQAELVLQ